MRSGKWLILFISIFISILFFTGCRKEPQYCKISTKVAGAKITGFEKELNTPVSVEKKGHSPIELEFTQVGFHPKKIMWDPKMKETKLFVKLEPIIKSIKIETVPNDAFIRYEGLIFKSEESIKLDYKSSMRAKVLKEGYKPYTVVIKINEVQNKYKVVLNKEPIEFFYIELKEAVLAKDDSKVLSLTAPYTKGNLNLQADDYDSEYRLKYSKLLNLAAEFYHSSEWDNLKYLLSFNIPGKMDQNPPITESFLEVPIKKDDPVLLRELVKAGAEMNAFLKVVCIYPDLFIAIENKSYKAMEELLKLGADPNGAMIKPPKIDGMSYTRYPLFYAVEMKDKKAFDLLVQYGALTSEKETEERYDHNEEGEMVMAQFERTLVEKNGTWEIIETKVK